MSVLVVISIWDSGCNRVQQSLLVKLGLLFACFMVAQATVVAADDGWTPVPNPPRANAEQCVEPTEVMRRDHMQFLLHQRDRTMRQGEGGSKHSLNGCVQCHARADDTGKPVSVNAEGEFCQACHAYTAVKMDCFECHASKPRNVNARGANAHKGREGER